MISYEPISGKRFTRNRDKAMIGGVCAGLADYFGFNLCATRALTVVSLLMAMPLTLMVYFGMVFLVPASSGASADPGRDEGFRKAVRSDPGKTLHDVKRRFQALDNRLARLERYVTSPRFDLDREFEKL